MVNLNETKARIKNVGTKNVRVVPMSGQGFSGDHQIEVCDGGIWTPIAIGLTKTMAEGIVRDALSRVICG